MQRVAFFKEKYMLGPEPEQPLSKAMSPYWPTSSEVNAFPVVSINFSEKG
jgi:hypothetical protein